MKALSIRQPWAWLIINGYKDIENRTWRTHFRGRFLIHAGKRFDKEGYESVKKNFPEIQMPEPEEFDFGGIVGEAELIDCIEPEQCVPVGSGWHQADCFGFVLSNAKKADSFRPLRGQLGFFKVGQQ